MRAGAQVRAEPQLLLVRPEVRGRGWGQPRNFKVHAQLVKLAVAFGQLPFQCALRLGRSLLQDRDLRCEIGDSLLLPAVRGFDRPRAQVFQFRPKRGEAFHQRQF